MIPWPPTIQGRRNSTTDPPDSQSCQVHNSSTTGWLTLAGAARGVSITDYGRKSQLDKQVEHYVDREECLRRDREIQRALERMATKDELRDVNDILRSIQESISPQVVR